MPATLRRWDVAVKWRYFKHLQCGGDPEAIGVYRWHIAARSGQRFVAGIATDQWKRSVDDYVVAAQAVFASMARDGFNSRYPIQLDPDGELLGGAHRLAAALALGLPSVPCEIAPYKVWAPPWGEAWFQEHMTVAMVDRVRADWERLKA